MARKRVSKTYDDDIFMNAPDGGMPNEDDDLDAGATIEEMLDEVDKIIAQLDSGEIPLEESFTIYERGMKLVSSINTRIDKVEKKVIEIEAKCSNTMPEDDESLPFN
jgi:exodeoxyribonuclease VII small subunit